MLRNALIMKHLQNCCIIMFMLNKGFGGLSLGGLTPGAAPSFNEPDTIVNGSRSYYILA